MSLLAKKRHANKGLLLTTTRCFKLAAAEALLLDRIVTSSGKGRSEWIREVVLRELKVEPDRGLAELIGVRLLLVNVLRPMAAGQKMSPESFDKLLDEIGRAKFELALQKNQNERLTSND